MDFVDQMLNKLSDLVGERRFVELETDGLEFKPTPGLRIDRQVILSIKPGIYVCIVGLAPVKRTIGGLCRGLPSAYFFFSFAQESFRLTERLKTSLPAVESLSTVK
jgi:hypothetical protein